MDFNILNTSCFCLAFENAMLNQNIYKATFFLDFLVCSFCYFMNSFLFQDFNCWLFLALHEKSLAQKIQQPQEIVDSHQCSLQKVSIEGGPCQIFCLTFFREILKIDKAWRKWIHDFEGVGGNHKDRSWKNLQMLLAPPPF